MARVPSSLMPSATSTSHSMPASSWARIESSTSAMHPASLRQGTTIVMESAAGMRGRPQGARQLQFARRQLAHYRAELAVGAARDAVDPLDGDLDLPDPLAHEARQLPLLPRVEG